MWNGIGSASGVLEEPEAEVKHSSLHCSSLSLLRGYARFLQMKGHTQLGLSSSHVLLCEFNNVARYVYFEMVLGIRINNPIITPQQERKTYDPHPRFDTTA